MIRNIKALGLAIVAVAAMSMVAASAVQASELHVTTAENNAVITGQQTGINRFQITPPEGASVECEEATFEGTVSRAGAGQQITTKDTQVTATYAKCTAFGIGSQVLMNGCKYTITGEHTPAGQQTPVTANPANGKTAYVDITGCTSGKQVEVKAPGCTIKVPEQNTLSHLVFSNTGSGNTQDVDVEITVTGITYQVSGLLCGHTTNVTTHDGVYTGNATFRAYKDTAPQQVTLHGHQYSKLGDDLQVQLGLVAT